VTGESLEAFDCFGGRCSVRVSGAAGERAAEDAVEASRRQLLDWHARFSRFIADSELSRLNEDPRSTVPVGALMARLATAVREAGSLSGGLVDGTLAEQIASAGYTSDLYSPLPLRRALGLAPARTAAGPSPTAGWRRLTVDEARATITREAGVQLDSGGLAKGLFADVLSTELSGHAAYAVDCAGDLALGGTDGVRREVHVQSPFDEGVLHTFAIARGGVATSGIGRRAWLDGEGRPCHHLLDPATGRPAFTGIVQVTALADTALEAEIRAKAALLSGPARASWWLPRGGLIVLDDGDHRVIEPAPVVSRDELAAYVRVPASARS
jgi:thiamine biosynthesis lipoprotein